MARHCGLFLGLALIALMGVMASPADAGNISMQIEINGSLGVWQRFATNWAIRSLERFTHGLQTGRPPRTSR